MAKTSVKARQKKRERMVAQYAEKRKELKKAGDWKSLDDLPKNSSKVRLKNLCVIWHWMEKFQGLEKQAGKLDAGCLILDDQYLISRIQNQKKFRTDQLK